MMCSGDAAMDHDRAVTATLVLLAAGMGRRFGGPKQLTPCGPDGEPLFVLTAREAVAVGFGHVVVVTRFGLRAEVESIIATHLGDHPVDLVIQDRSGPLRATSWGTGHAVGLCAPLVDGPVGVANADDYYGADAVRRLRAATMVLGDDEGVVVAYRLGDTLSEHGPVNRAVLRLEDGRVVAITERRGLRREGNRIVDGEGARLAADTPVSMNLVGLGAAVPSMLAHRFEAFAAAHRDDDVEMVLPDELDVLLAAGLVVLSRVPGGRTWVGLTVPADITDVRAALALEWPVSPSG